MKIFVSDSGGKRKISDEDYQFTDNQEPLRFGLFSLPRLMGLNENIVNDMYGMRTDCATNHIYVKDVDKTREEYYDLLKTDVKSFAVKDPSKTDEYIISFCGEIVTFNLTEQIDELLQKASLFNDGERVRVKGRKVFKA